MITTRSPVEIAEWAIDCLDIGIRGSLIRLGDGEGRLLMWPQYITRGEMIRRLIYWFGRGNFAERDIAKMRRLLVDAIGKADGVCYKKGQTDRYWRYPETWMGQHCEHDVWTNDNDLHIYLWQDGLLDEIVQEAKRVVLVTCRNVVDDFEARYGKKTYWVRVPEEGHTGERPTEHWAMHEQIAAEAAGNCGPGTLALVGAGFLGKWYATMCAEMGGVALDVGSLFDLWSGVRSRSWVKEYLTIQQNRCILDVKDEADLRAM